jgi:hypothetical protein
MEEGIKVIDSESEITTIFDPPTVKLRKIKLIGLDPFQQNCNN